MHIKVNRFVPLGFAAVAFAAAPVEARIIRLAIEHRDALTSQSPLVYEKLTGRVDGELDPKDPLNAIITDIQFAPQNARGMVEYSATFSMVKPADMAKASGVLVYLVPNRGRMRLDSANSLSADFRKYGHVIVASGWQGDIAPAPGIETITVPVAKNPDGSSITGPVLARFFDMAPNTNTLPILRGGVPRTAPPASLDSSTAMLTRRASEGGKVVPLAPGDWAFANCAKVPFPGEPDPHQICLKNGFDPAYLYELVYTAKDPLVLGIGFAATRDLNSFFRYAARDETGAANPVAGKIAHAISQGESQSGTFLRSMIHLGFNQDESGRIVFDGVDPFVAVRLLAMNIRFAAPGGAVSMYDPGSDGILWWGESTDEARHRSTGSLLDRCHASETCPKIVEIFGSAEIYNLRASPNLVGTRADRDIPLPPNVRRYYIPGVSHNNGRGGFDAATPRPPACCELPTNVNSERETLRALLVALVDWVVKGTPPPPSQYPRLDRGELVPPRRVAMGFPVIPGVPFPDGLMNPFYDYDFGPQFHYRDLSGVITRQPAPIRQILPMLVPRVDADGNEVGGVPSVLHQAPLGTYTGWNIIAKGFYKDTADPQEGSFIPFARTKAEREASGDPRLSLEERYGTHEKYVAAVRAAATKMVRERFLLPEDADRLIAEADRSNILSSR